MDVVVTGEKKKKKGQKYIIRLSEFRSIIHGSRRDNCTKQVGVQRMTVTVMFNTYLLIIILQSLFCGLFYDIISI